MWLHRQPVVMGRTLPCTDLLAQKVNFVSIAVSCVLVSSRKYRLLIHGLSISTEPDISMRILFDGTILNDANFVIDIHCSNYVPSIKGIARMGSLRFPESSVNVKSFKNLLPVGTSRRS